MLRFAGLVVTVATVLCLPAAAQAQDSELQSPPAETGQDGQWHVDALVAAMLPIAPSSYTDIAGFGGGLIVNAYRDWLDLELDLAAFASESTTAAEQLHYRVRALAGYRHAWEIERHRAAILRILAGGELGGFDAISSDSWTAEAYRPGLATMVAFESRSQLDWGVVSLMGGLAVSAQPFGNDARDEAEYVGIELLAGIGVGF